METAPPTLWVAFARTRCVALGTPHDVASQVKALVDRDQSADVLVLDGVTSQLVELDLRGSLAAVLNRLPSGASDTPTGVAPASAPDQTPSAPRGPGRPRLGVIAREVTLLPRHWDWLAAQPGGASTTLRKLTELARRTSRQADELRIARESAYRFMTAMAGDVPGFEEATRALFQGDIDAAAAQMKKWPADVRRHALRLLDATRLALP